MATSLPILMPKLGLTMTEGMLAEWKVAPGDAVTAGQVLFVVETDKIANEIEAQQAGVVEALLAEPGDVLAVGAVLARLQVAGENALAAPSLPAPALSSPDADLRIIATPLARRMAAKAGLDLAQVAGRGPRGRIMAGDVSAVLDEEPATGVAPAPAALPTQVRERKPSAFQKVTARRLTQAKQDIPHFYIFAKADVTDLLVMREQLNSGSGASKLTVSHFVIAAVARALAAMPEMNCVWAGEVIHDLPTVDIGMAVESPKGLVAPVLHDLGDLTLDEVAVLANGLVARAREGKLAPEDLRGGAVSISNVGMFGASALLPIINPGQSSILGVGAAQTVFLPDAHGRPVLRQVLELALSCDHRVIDGALAARFLQAICRHLECAATLLRRPQREPLT